MTATTSTKNVGMEILPTPLSFTSYCSLLERNLLFDSSGIAHRAPVCLPRCFPPGTPLHIPNHINVSPEPRPPTSLDKILHTSTAAARHHTIQSRACFRRRPLGLSLLEKPHPHSPFESLPSLSSSLELPPCGLDSAENVDVDVDVDVPVSDGPEFSKI